MTGIDTVVFDIGNVLLDWDPRHLYRKMFADHSRMEWFLTHVCSPDWNRRQDAGRAWAEAEADLLARYPDLREEIIAFRGRWPEMVSGPLHDTVAVLEELRSANVPLYAITNFAADTFAVARSIFGFLGLFRGVVVSGAVKLMKPDPAIYHRLACDHAVDLSRAVFIDDSHANCEGARRAGMAAAIHFKGAAPLRDELRALGLPIMAAGSALRAVRGAM
ncbi:MAG: HAD-IA family hydrolase [Hyphomicrobiaceae bacterium]|nr:MAG: HAD-IA family hydrolase [Hyphomicrobiaceae bacterium]